MAKTPKKPTKTPTKKTITMPKIESAVGDHNVLAFAPVVRRIRHHIQERRSTLRISEAAARLMSDLIQADIQKILSKAAVIAAQDSRRRTVLKRDVATVFSLEA